MSKVTGLFTINGEVWTPSQIERLEYERNLHVLHQMKQHGIEIKDGDKILTHDDIDYLTAKDAWRVSIETRAAYSATELIEYYKDSFAKSDAMWRELGFAQDKPMKVSYCTVEVHGMTLEEYMVLMQAMKEDERILLAAHPEHFQTLVTDEKIIGIEPFGAYGTPTLVEVQFTDITGLGERIKADKREDYPIAMGGRAFLTDGVTEVNSPYHQFKPTEDGFEVITAVYWPEGVADEVVSGHALHLAMEFYRGMKIAEGMRDSKPAEAEELEGVASPVEEKTNGRFDENSTLEEVMNHPEGLAIAKKHLGDILNRPGVETMKTKSLQEIVKMIPLPMVKKKVKNMMIELSKLA